MDPVFGFQAVNVEAQLRSPTSLLRWLQRFVALRKEHPVFGLGTYATLETSNPRIFAHVRQSEHDTVLCVHNLARSAQAVELDLSRFRGRTPVEMIGHTQFPSIGELPYLLTFGPRGFYWFLLPEEDAMRDPRALSSDELLSLVVGARWFAAKGRAAEAAEVVDVPVEDEVVALAIVEVRFAAGTHEHYLIALDDSDETVDAFDRPEVATRLASLAGVPAEGARVRPVGVEQSNSSVVLDELHVLKLYRRLEAGPNPELELLRALAARAVRERAAARGRARHARAAARDRARVGHRLRARRSAAGGS